MRIKSFADLRAYWREDYAANNRRFWEPGFQALAIHRFGVWVDGIGWAPARFLLRRLYFLLSGFAKLFYGVEVPYTAEVGRRLRLAHGQCGVVIGRFCRIGDDCVIRHNVTLGRLSGPSSERDVPRLGNRVEIGAGAVIVGPVTIGDDAIIGPNVVVREDVPPESTVMPQTPQIKPRRRLRRKRQTLTSV
jgi:serine O-acetyltransferase